MARNDFRIRKLTNLRKTIFGVWCPRDSGDDDSTPPNARVGYLANSYGALSPKEVRGHTITAFAVLPSDRIGLEFSSAPAYIRDLLLRLYVTGRVMQFPLSRIGETNQFISAVRNNLHNQAYARRGQGIQFMLTYDA